MDRIFVYIVILFLKLKQKILQYKSIAFYIIIIIITIIIIIIIIIIMMMMMMKK